MPKGLEVKNLKGDFLEKEVLDTMKEVNDEKAFRSEGFLESFGCFS